MIFGVFFGNSPQSIERRIAALEQKRNGIKQTISDAIADRTTAIAELNKELVDLNLLKSRV